MLLSKRGHHRHRPSGIPYMADLTSRWERKVYVHKVKRTHYRFVEHVEMAQNLINHRLNWIAATPLNPPFH